MDPDTGAYTNNIEITVIEREWCGVRNMVQNMGRKVGYERYFDRAVFLKMLKCTNERVRAFWNQVAKVYLLNSK